MAVRTYQDVTELIRHYYHEPTGNYINETVQIDSETLTCDIYVVPEGASIDSTIFVGCTGNDARTQVIVGKNLTVQQDTILTPPYRCKGLIIGVPGRFTNLGTVSMSDRGASAVGQNIKLTEDYTISALGGAGGAAVKDGVGGNGATASTLGCSGGGAGGAGAGNTTGHSSGGAGGAGTSFSGGAGGGAGGVSSSPKNGYAGSSQGGAGGKGGNAGGAGGGGNPGGAGGSSGRSGNSGTGGLCVIVTKSFVNSGLLASYASGSGGNGTSGTSAGGGGGAGAGCIVTISESCVDEGSVDVHGASGGTQGASFSKAGGRGGDGKYSNLIVSHIDLDSGAPLKHIVASSSSIDLVPNREGQLIFGSNKSELAYDWDLSRFYVGDSWEGYAQ